MMEIGYESLVNIPGVGSSLADAFFEKGIYSAEELAESEVEELIEIRGIGQEKAAVLIENARQYAIEAAEAAESRRLEEAAARALEEATRSETEDDAVPAETPTDESNEGAASGAETPEAQQ
jgi:N utilization substance protein A